MMEQKLCLKNIRIVYLNTITRELPLPIIHALNIGIEKAKGEIICFLDDDTIPEPNWLSAHVANYDNPKVGGVAGNVISTTMNNLNRTEKRSDVIKECTPFMPNFARAFWERPITGLENNLIYLSRAGTLCHDSRIAKLAWHSKVSSLLGMGANISILAAATKNIRFPEDSWAIGLNWEQYLGLRIWRKGYQTIFDLEPTVKHIIKGETTTYNVLSNRRHALIIIEHSLMFYRLLDNEKQMSKKFRVSWIFFFVLMNLWKANKEKNFKRIVNIAAVVYAELLGLKWLISKKSGCNYSPKTDLDKFL